jgi:hypothetical protein
LVAGYNSRTIEILLDNQDQIGVIKQLRRRTCKIIHHGWIDNDIVNYMIYYKILKLVKYENFKVLTQLVQVIIIGKILQKLLNGIPMNIN